MSSLLTGFDPITMPTANVLILGTAPSVASLAAQQYYAHPRNAFWRIMCALLNAPPDLDYAARAELLKRHEIALWDVLQHCERPGSLDSNIKKGSEQANDFVGFLGKHPRIHTVFFNGQKAAALFEKLVAPGLADRDRRLASVTLPSTSPANTIKFEKKLEAWQQVREGPS